MPTEAEPKAKFFRLTIPVDDTATWDWLKSQYNGSFSLRRLIHDDIAANGYSDVHSRIPVLPNQVEDIEVRGNANV